MSGQHTPGPWKVELIGDPRVLATDAKGDFPVCDIRGWGHLTGKGHGALGLSETEAAAIQDANARLIASAPDLLVALTQLHRTVKVYQFSPDGSIDQAHAARDMDDAMDAAKAALSKAGGLQPSPHSEQVRH